MWFNQRKLIRIESQKTLWVEKDNILNEINEKLILDFGRATVNFLKKQNVNSPIKMTMREIVEFHEDGSWSHGFENKLNIRIALVDHLNEISELSEVKKIIHACFESGVLSMVIFGLTMSWRGMDGAFSSYTESFMILFSIISFSIIILGQNNRTEQSILPLIAGISMGIAIAFRSSG